LLFQGQGLLPLTSNVRILKLWNSTVCSVHSGPPSHCDTVSQVEREEGKGGSNGKEAKMKKGAWVKSERKVEELIVLIRGAGEMASGVAHRLHQSHFKICMLEIPHPLAVRREVSFCEAIYGGEKEVEGVRAKFISTPNEIQSAWKEGKIPLLVDSDGKKTKSLLKPDVLVDAILAKKNLGTHIKDAALVIGLGPGFTAGKDVHIVVETNRGQNLGKMILNGTAEPDTGIPGEVGGFMVERVLRTMKKGIFRPQKSIGDRVSKGSVVAVVDDFPVIGKISGVVRGLLRERVEVRKGMKVGDIDPRGKRELCFTISDKARAIGGGVLEAILYWYNR
jgi:xanthine dehydrogenase accessory factor